MRFLLIIGLLFGTLGKAYSQHFSTNEDYQQAYSLLLDLKFEEAERKIQAIRMADEQNLATVYLEDLSDFLFIVVTEDEEQFNQTTRLITVQITSGRRNSSSLGIFQHAFWRVPKRSLRHQQGIQCVG